MTYMSMAEACGETEPRPMTFIPGEDFDPDDEDDVAAVGLAMDREHADTIDALRAENARLRQLLAENTPPF